ncbi:PEP-CTERM sorting domain-containing protein [Mariniblastus sp.]|nr:PEP-CTERM sorting domain-containing protein [Mariniblastus sp.]
MASVTLSWGQVQQFEISGEVEFFQTVVLDEFGFSGSFSIDPNSVDNNPAVDEGLFDLVDVDIDFGGSISAGTLVQRLGTAGELDQFLIFNSVDAGNNNLFEVTLESSSTLSADPNVVSLFELTDVGISADLFADGIDEPFASGSFSNFSIVETTAVPEPGTAFVTGLSLLCLSLSRRRRA